MSLNWRNLKNRLLRFVSPRPSGGLDRETLKQMAREIAMSQPGEIGCDECFEQMDRFVEIELAGTDAAEAMPLVQDHLERCVACWEEYEALLLALKAAG